jgi:hypothetical protein
MNRRGGEFLKRAIVVFIGQDSFPQQAVKQFIDNVGAVTKTIFCEISTASGGERDADFRKNG